MQPHCHHHSVMGFTKDEQLLTSAGYDIEVSAGCCGLAGNFGMQKGHYEISATIAHQGILAKTNAAPANHTRRRIFLPHPNQRPCRLGRSAHRTASGRSTPPEAASQVIAPQGMLSAKGQRHVKTCPFRVFPRLLHPKGKRANKPLSPKPASSRTCQGGTRITGCSKPLNYTHADARRRKNVPVASGQ